MGFIEVEEFALAGVGADEFARLDAELQAWTYVNRPGVLRRTTARSEDGDVLVLTHFGGTAPPAPPSPGATPVDGFQAAVDPTSYRRVVYRDLD